MSRNWQRRKTSTNIRRSDRNLVRRQNFRQNSVARQNGKPTNKHPCSRIKPTYFDIIWGDKDNKSMMDDLQIIQNKAAKVILSWPMYSSSSCALDELTRSPLSSRRQFNRAGFTYKCINGMIDYDLKWRPNRTVHNYNTQRENDMHLPTVKD